MRVHHAIFAVTIVVGCSDASAPRPPVAPTLLAFSITQAGNGSDTVGHFTISRATNEWIVSGWFVTHSIGIPIEAVGEVADTTYRITLRHGSCPNDLCAVLPAFATWDYTARTGALPPGVRRIVVVHESGMVRPRDSVFAASLLP